MLVHKLSRVVLCLTTVATIASVGRGDSMSPSDSMSASDSMSGGVSGREVIDGRAVRLGLETRRTLEESLTDYSVFELPLVRVQRQVASGRLELRLAERSFSFEMSPQSIFTDDFRWATETAHGAIEESPGPVSTYVGRAPSDAAVWARFSSRADHFGGSVRSHDEWLFIDPLSEFVEHAAANLVVVYRDLDVRPDPARACGATELYRTAHEISKQIPAAAPRESSRGRQGGLPIAEFSLEVDGKYFEDYGNPGTKDRIVDFMFEVVGFFEDDLDIALRFAYGHLWTDAGTDPYTTNDAFTVFDQFVTYWLENQPQYDVMHMFSGKTFDLGIVGIAYLDAVCCVGLDCPPGAFGLSQDMAGRSDRKTLAAHEIGHNFSARHDDEFPINCPGVDCGSFGPIMCSFLQEFGSQKFSMCSQDDIGDWVANNGSCLD